MKKAFLILLIAAIAITSVFARSSITTSVGYDMETFGLFNYTDNEKTVAMFHGLGFGIKANVNFFDTLIDSFGITGAVDGFVPFYGTMSEGHDACINLYQNNDRTYGIKTKLGVEYTHIIEYFDLSVGLNGVYSALFATTEKVTAMNCGIGMDLGFAYHLTDNISVGASCSPKLMFAPSYIISEKKSGWSTGPASFSCNGRLTVVYNF